MRRESNAPDNSLAAVRQGTVAQLDIVTLIVGIDRLKMKRLTYSPQYRHSGDAE